MSLDKVFDHLKKSQQTISFVESCTGGGLAKEIVSKSGASSVFEGSLVVYTDKAKAEILGIDENLLKVHTAVSDIVVRQMASAGAKKFASFWCLSTSGWLGPTGGTKADPVGTVYFAVTGPGLEVVDRRTFKSSNGRAVLMSIVNQYAWDLLLKVIKGDK